MRSQNLCIPVLLLLLTYCSNPSGHQVERSIMEDVQTISTTGGPKYDTPLFELESELVLGVDEGEPAWQMFTSTPRFLFSPDGTIVMVDTREFIIRIVSHDGQLLHQSGRRGSGPGEFQNILDTFWIEMGREFWLTDQMNNRITKMSMDGKLLGEFNYSEIRMNFTRFWHLDGRRLLAMGRIFDPDRGPVGSPQRYVMLNEQMEITEDIFTLEGPIYYQSRERGYSPVPYSGYDRPTVFPDGRILLLQPNYPRMTVYSPSGEPQLHIERDWELIPVTQEEKQTIRNRARDRDTPAKYMDIPFPDSKPPFGTALIDTEGRIWLRRYEMIREEGTDEEPGAFLGYLYEIYSPEGVWIGNHIHQRTIRFITGEYLYQTYSSEAGAPRFERLRINPLVREMRPGRNE